MKKSKNKLIKTPYIPRILIKMNTGTRVILSKRDKAMSRRALNMQARNYM